VTDISPAVVELRYQWPNLCALDRAQAVHTIQQEGMSLRELARHLECSHSLLSYLLRVAQAPAEDLERARRGEISTRALARIARTAGTRGTVSHPEAIAFERERAAFQASKTVLSWFEDEEVAAAEQGGIIEEARLHLAEAQDCKVTFLEERLLDAVHKFRSTQIEAGGNRPLAWFALRLALWALRTNADDRVRNRALELACWERSHSLAPTA
jgi:transposase-like protein